MNLTYQELRNIKHQLPTGSIAKIASELQLEEQTVRNYFGAQKYADGRATGVHKQPGPHGGVVHLNDDSIINAAMRIINQTN